MPVKIRKVTKNMATFGNILLWVVYPYLMLGSFFIGTIWRMRRPGTVTAKSSEFLEKKRLIWGSILFHVGLLGVFGGHFIGIFIPESWTSALGISEHFYHVYMAMAMGGVFGAMFVVGALVLVYRRFTTPKVFVTSSLSDTIVIVALTITIILGMLSSFVSGPMHPDFNYRESISVWARGLFILQPKWQLMAGVPLMYKIHIICGFAMFGFFPYTRLVHALYVPIQYLGRRYVVYRRYKKEGE